MEDITKEQLNELKAAGYTEEQISSAMLALEENELKSSYDRTITDRNNDPRQYSQMSSFMPAQDDNLIKWQLELNDILERAEHILRGDVPKYRNGVLIWEKSEHPEKNPFNEWGIQEIMKILSMYINRNTILSDYNNEEINYKVFDFGRRLNNLFFMRYDELGMDNEQKRKNYEMLVTEMKDIVHDTYKRALDGAEKRSLREMISVSQQTSTNSNIGGGFGVNQQGQVAKERGLLNPLRYTSGKYK